MSGTSLDGRGCRCDRDGRARYHTAFGTSSYRSYSETRERRHHRCRVLANGRGRSISGDASGRKLHTLKALANYTRR